MSEDESNTRVNVWLLEQFRAAEEPYASRKVKHLQHCPTTGVVACEHGWECSCYSEYTRDDKWKVAADFACRCGTSSNYSFPRLDWGALPALIQLIRDADADSCECPYGEDDDE